MKKEELLIIDKHQFGYLTDIYKWCEFLNNHYKITVISADLGEPKIKIPGVKVIYVPFNLPKAIRGRLFVLISLIYTLFFKGIVIVEYFRRCSIIPSLFPNKKIVLDIRTLSVSSDIKHRESYNSAVKSESGKFKYRMTISNGVAQQIDSNLFHILPLGSDVFSKEPKDYKNAIHLLYVGTLRWRRIEDTIIGLSLFLKKNPQESIHYDIVGDGEPGQLEQLMNLSKELGLTDIITFHGWVSIDKLSGFFDKANVGICFVPVTPYYDHQPPTKTFEYCNSGIYCLATGTSANKELITVDNGIIIDDTPDGVCEGLESFIKIKDSIRESGVRSALRNFTWKEIVLFNLKTYLDQIYNE